MKIHKYVEVVPEHTVERTEYISSDGKTFYDKDQCLDYEDKLKKRTEILSHSVFQSRESTYIWPDDDHVTMYLLTSKNDYDYLMDHVDCGEAEQDDFKHFGPGLYLLYVDSVGDSKPTYRLHYLDYYMKLLEMEFSNWKDEMEVVGKKVVNNFQKTLIDNGI